jgi:tetratricopeptide (TPR) repeat protein
MMKKYILAGSIALLTAACGDSAAEVAKPADNANTAPETARSQRMRSMIDHTTENQTPKPADPSEATGGRWTASGDPIDTTEFDAAISDAERSYKARPNDTAARTAAAEAYFKRGFALTEARQYASAIGDYRRALKIDPDHGESKKWEQQIIGIYGMMKKEYPKPGEEPPPLPFKKS